MISNKFSIILILFNLYSTGINYFQLIITGLQNSLNQYFLLLKAIQ